MSECATHRSFRYTIKKNEKKEEKTPEIYGIRKPENIQVNTGATFFIMLETLNQRQGFLGETNNRKIQSLNFVCRVLDIVLKTSVRTTVRQRYLLGYSARCSTENFEPVQAGSRNKKYFFRVLN